MKQMNFTANRWKFTILPVAIILIGLVFLLINKGFNYDIEFMGGVRMQVELGTTYENDELVKLIKEKNNVDVTIQKGGVDTQVIVNGIETKEVFDLINKMGADRFSGPYFGEFVKDKQIN